MLLSQSVLRSLPLGQGLRKAQAAGRLQGLHPRLLPVALALVAPVLTAPALAVSLQNGGLIPAPNLTAPSAGINAGTGVGNTVPSIYTITGWTVVDNPRQVNGWQNNLMYTVSDGQTFSKEGAGLNAAQQNGRRNWTLFGTPGQTVNSPTGSGWYLASDGDPAYSGSIQQELSGLIAGTTYDVGFYQAAGQFNCYLDGGQCFDGPYNQATTNWWEVSFGGATKSSPTMAQPANAPVSPWQKQVLSFVAGGPTALLEFMANGTPGNQPPTALLSSITVTPQGGPPDPPNPPSSVPGPLGVTGFATAFGLSRRLRHRLRGGR